MDKLLTVAEVAEQLSVTEETVRRWLRDGRLEGVRLSRRAGWRIRQSSVDELLEGYALEGKLAA
ncbi:MAG: helix-turn-helix domain-containing protein [Chloroflexota bacterium]|nr:helix-turn-helix domain-containing protein [Chloroflexota bacterium]